MEIEMVRIIIAIIGIGLTVLGLVAVWLVYYLKNKQRKED